MRTTAQTRRHPRPASASARAWPVVLPSAERSSCAGRQSPVWRPARGNGGVRSGGKVRAAYGNSLNPATTDALAPVARTANLSALAPAAAPAFGAAACAACAANLHLVTGTTQRNGGGGATGERPVSCSRDPVAYAACAPGSKACRGRALDLSASGGLSAVMVTRW